MFHDADLYKQCRRDQTPEKATSVQRFYCLLLIQQFYTFLQTVNWTSSVVRTNTCIVKAHFVVIIRFHTVFHCLGEYSSPPHPPPYHIYARYLDTITQHFQLHSETYSPRIFKAFLSGSGAELEIPFYHCFPTLSDKSVVLTQR